MTNEKDRDEAEKLFESFNSKVYEYLRSEDWQYTSGTKIKLLFIEMAVLGYARIRAEAIRAALAEYNTHRWNVEKTEDGISICFGGHDRSADCEYIEHVPKSAIAEAVKAERERCRQKINDLDSKLPAFRRSTYEEGYGDCIGDAEAAILSDAQEAPPQVPSDEPFVDEISKWM